MSRLRTRGGGFPIAPATPSACIPCHLVVIQRWQVAAALSAAVTTTYPIGDQPYFQAEPSQKKSHIPNASRSSGGSAREGAFLQKSLLPRNHPRTLWRFYALF